MSPLELAAAIEQIADKYWARVDSHKGKPTYLTQVEDSELMTLLSVADAYARQCRRGEH